LAVIATFIEVWCKPKQDPTLSISCLGHCNMDLTRPETYFVIQKACRFM